jgi:predicted nucleotidyltransferase
MALRDNEKISKLIAEQSDENLHPGINALSEAARERHGDSVRAVLFYGSCLRSGNVTDGLADLYVLVDDYKSAFNSSVLAFFNKLLPPNVFYLEIPFEDHLLRAKYAVLTLADFRKGTEHWFHSYLWGRFAQKTSIIYATDENVEHQVLAALERAVTKFVSQTVPQMDTKFSARDLWSRGLSLSYHSELRTEEPEQAAEFLFDANPAYYQSLTRLTLEALPINIKVNEESGAFYRPDELPGSSKRLNDLSWRLRFLQGKVLSVLRLLKGLYTFDGGINYILWKIERHSGVRVEVGPGLRRFPPVAMVVIFWRLYRQNAFR